jgi:hypothetical protein
MKLNCYTCGQRLQIPLPLPPLDKTVLGKLPEQAPPPAAVHSVPPPITEVWEPPDEGPQADRVYCPVCAVEIPFGATRCKNCGESLVDERPRKPDEAITSNASPTSNAVDADVVEPELVEAVDIEPVLVEVVKDDPQRHRRGGRARQRDEVVEHRRRGRRLRDEDEGEGKSTASVVCLSVGILCLAIGAVMLLYYFDYDTSVPVFNVPEPAIGVRRVHNVGKMQNRMVGIAVSIAMLAGGLTLTLVGALRK